MTGMKQSRFGRRTRYAAAAVIAFALLAMAQSASAQSPHGYLAGDPAGQVIALFKPFPDSERPLYAVVGSGTDFGPLQALTTQRRSGAEQGFSLAGNERGDAIAVWIEPRPRRSAGPIFASVHTAGAESFSAPAVLPGGLTSVVRPVVNARGDALVTAANESTPSQWWRVAGGEFTGPQPLPSTQVGLDDRGEALAVWSAYVGSSDRAAFWATAALGGAWSEPRAFAPPLFTPSSDSGLMKDLSVTGTGLGLALAEEYGGKPVRVISRAPGADQWVVEYAFPAGFEDRVSVAIGERGDAVLWWRRGKVIYASVRSPEGTWGAPEPAFTDLPPWPYPDDYRGSTMHTRGAVSADGTIAIVGQEDDSSIAVAYREPGGRFTRIRLRNPAPHELQARRVPALLLGRDGAGIAAWQEADGDRVKLAARTFDRNGPGAQREVAAVRQWAREGPASACRPRGSRTITQTRVARIYKRGNSLYGCMFARGKPVWLPPPHGDETPEAFVSGPSMLAGPVAAVPTIVEDHSVDTEILDAYWRVIDLRDEENGVRRWVPLDGDVASDLVLNERGGLAWIACRWRTQIARRTCRPGDPTLALRARDSGSSSKTRVLARGRSVAPRSLTLRGSKLNWTENGRRHSARLR